MDRLSYKYAIPLLGVDRLCALPQYRRLHELELVLAGVKTAVTFDGADCYDVSPGDRVEFYDHQSREALCQVRTRPYPIEEVSARRWLQLECLQEQEYHRLAEQVGCHYHQFQFEFLRAL